MQPYMVSHGSCEGTYAARYMSVTILGVAGTTLSVVGNMVG